MQNQNEKLIDQITAANSKYMIAGTHWLVILMLILLTIAVIVNYFISWNYIKITRVAEQFDNVYEQQNPYGAMQQEYYRQQ